MINPGQMRHRITIQKPNGTMINAAHEETPDYIDWVTIWAAIIPLRGREYLEAQKLRAETAFRVEVRYMAGITPDMLVKLIDGRILQIQNVLNIEERNIELHLMCIEKVM